MEQTFKWKAHDCNTIVVAVQSTVKIMACLEGEFFLHHALHKYKNLTLVEIWSASSSSSIPYIWDWGLGMMMDNIEMRI